MQVPLWMLCLYLSVIRLSRTYIRFRLYSVYWYKNNKLLTCGSDPGHIPDPGSLRIDRWRYWRKSQTPFHALLNVPDAQVQSNLTSRSIVTVQQYSASEVTTVWRYRNSIIIIINMFQVGPRDLLLLLLAFFARHPRKKTGATYALSCDGHYNS